MTAAAAALEGVRALVFDAYGTLFDVTTTAGRCRSALGERHAALSRLWRQKQLEYSWLRTLMGQHADFWQVTADALDYALEALALPEQMRDSLLDVYRRLDAYPDARPTLERLRGQGLRTAILSNGSPAMLASATEGAGLGPLLDAVISVEKVGRFKPAPVVYRLAVEQFGFEAPAIGFISANGWDVAGGGAFGFRAVWINRDRAPVERLPAVPAAQIAALAELPALIGRAH